MDVITLHIKGIKCDAVDCDYNNDEAKFEEYDQWLNRPCPKCGANLLTQEALDAVKWHVAAANHMNALYRDLLAQGLAPPVSEHDEKILLRATHDHEGKPTGFEIVSDEVAA